MKDRIVLQIEEYAKKCSMNNDPGHDFLHIQRVVKMALHLAKTVTCDEYLVHLLALLHDIEDKKFQNDNKVKDYLVTIDLSEDYKEKILYILPYMSFSKYPTLPDVFPIEGKIIQDADRLDAIGAIGIARAFSYGGSKNRPMYDADNSTIKHFDKKLLILDKYLYLDESKRIAKERMKILKDFYKEFNKEVE